MCTQMSSIAIKLRFGLETSALRFALASNFELVPRFAEICQAPHPQAPRFLTCHPVYILLVLSRRIPTCAIVDFVDVSAWPVGLTHSRLLIRNFLTAKLFWFWCTTCLIWDPSVAVMMEFVEFRVWRIMWCGMLGWIESCAANGLWRDFCPMWSGDAAIFIMSRLVMWWQGILNVEQANLDNQNMGN